MPLVPLHPEKWDQAPLSKTPMPELKIAPDTVTSDAGPTGPTGPIPKQDFQKNVREDLADDELWEVGEV